MGARIVAVAALLAVTGALAFVVMSAPADREPGPAEIDVSGLVVPMETVARQLEGLRKGQTARPAQRAVRRAMDAAERLKTRGEVTAEERVINAIDRATEYLDAVGSLLSNPRSPLRSEIADRASRARAALDAAPGGRGEVIRGWERLRDR